MVIHHFMSLPERTTWSAYCECEVWEVTEVTQFLHIRWWCWFWGNFIFFGFMSVMREESIIGNKQIQLFSYLVTAFLVFVCFLVSTTNRLFKHFVPYTQCSNVFSAAVESLIYKMQSASPESVLICKSSRTNSTWVCILGNQRSTDKTKWSR